MQSHRWREILDPATGEVAGRAPEHTAADLGSAITVACAAQPAHAGTVWINKHGAVDPRVPFGGAKQSGYGLEFGVEGLKHLAQFQAISY